MQLRTATQKQGYGRFNEQELENVTKGDLKALDGFLGKKRFFMGDKPTRVQTIYLFCIKYRHIEKISYIDS